MAGMGPLLAEAGFSGQRHDGRAGLVAQGESGWPAGTGRRDGLADGDVDCASAGEPVARADHVAAALDADRENRRAGGGGGGFERAEVERPYPGGRVQCPFGPDRQAAAAAQGGGECAARQALGDRAGGSRPPPQAVPSPAPGQARRTPRRRAAQRPRAGRLPPPARRDAGCARAAARSPGLISPCAALMRLRIWSGAWMTSSLGGTRAGARSMWTCSAPRVGAVPEIALARWRSGRMS
jgi:hypothetical protein